MKKIIITLFVLFNIFRIQAQIVNVCGTDSVTFEVDNYVNGTIEWQESVDTITWATIPEVSGNTYRFLPTQTKYYRAVVKTTDCQPLYSAISLVQLIPIANAGTDRTIGNTSMTLLGNAVTGATGEWTILSGNGGVLDNPTNPRALFTGINKETYSLKWTLTNACGQSSDTVAIAFDEIIAKNNFIVVDNTDSIFSDSTEMASGTYRIKFSDSTINPADSAMLIGMRSDISFLQKVNTFTLQDSIYTFTTEQGSFEELIKTGVLNIGDAVNQALMLDSPATQKTRSSTSQITNFFPTRQTLKENSNNKGIKLLYSQNTNENAYPKVRSISSLTNGDGFIITLPDISMFKIEGTFNASINNSFIRINPNFVLDYTYSFPANLTKLRFGVDNAEIEYNINSKLEVTAPIITNQEEKKIVGVTKYIVFMAGPVPVVVTANFDIKASIALDASAGITLEQKKSYKTNITALVVGESVNSLSLIKNSSESSTHEEKLTGIAKTSFEFNIGPEVSFKAYDFIGPYFKIPAKIKLSYCTNTNNNWSGEASIGYECKLGANAKVLGSTLFDFNYKFLKDDIMGNIKLPAQLELLSGNFQKGTNGNQLSKPILFRATSNLGFGVPFVPVRFTLEAGNGSVSQNVLLTDALGNVSVNWTLGSNPQNKLKVSVLDCNDNDIENSPMYVYASTASQTYDCTNSNLTIDIKTANGFMTPSVSGGTAPYTYSKNGVDYSSTVPKFNVLVSGNNTVYVKDKNQCIRTKAFAIQPIDACINSNLSLDIFVQPNILTIAGKNGKTPYLFAVDNTASFTTTSTYYKLSAGKHTVYIKDANGCVVSYDVTIDNATIAAIRSSYPIQGATSIPITPNTFQWTAATYTTNQLYDLYLKKGTDAYSLIGSNLSTTSFTYNTSLLASTTYTWKVAVKNGSTVIDYSEFIFTTASGVATAPTVPILMQPDNGASVYSPVTLKWTPQTGDFKYDLYLDANNASTLVALNLTNAEYTVNNLVSGKTYYWKVKIKSTIAGATSTSAVWSFTQLQNTHVAVFVTAGKLASTLSSGLKTITNLKLTGTIDARDFKTMRDDMPLLAVLDLSGTTVVAYTGTLGTNGSISINYPANVIPEHAFLYNTWVGKSSLISVLLPSSVTSIGNQSFMSCRYLTSAPIPSSVSTIGTMAFYECPITSINLTSSLTSIGDYAFARCNIGVPITIPSSVYSIGQAAFEGLKYDFTVDIGNLNYSSQNGVLFDKNKTTLIQCPTLKTGNYIIPSTVTSLSWIPFESCKLLSSIAIPASLTAHISDYAFNGCSGLITVESGNPNYSGIGGVLFNKDQTTLIHCPYSKTGNYLIPTTVKTLQNGAFYGCYYLTSIDLPSSVITIGGFAFASCSLLNTINIPSSVTSIGETVFNSCRGLTSIYVKVVTPIILDPNFNNFYGVDKESCVLYVPYGSKAAYQAANQWQDFKNIVEF